MGYPIDGSLEMLTCHDLEQAEVSSSELDESSVSELGSSSEDTSSGSEELTAESPSSPPDWEASGDSSRDLLVPLLAAGASGALLLLVVVAGVLVARHRAQQRRQALHQQAPAPGWVRPVSCNMLYGITLCG